VNRLGGRFASLVGGVVLSSACASLAPRPTEVDVARAPTRSPAVTLADLQRGRTLYLGRCASCHQPFDPASRSADSWPGYVDKMMQRAHLSGNDAALVVDYLVTMAHR
jgi:mono/diheme cytochrome c family protein